VICTSIFAEPMAHFIELKLGVASGVAQLVVTVTAVALALPFAFGLFRLGRSLGEKWALQVLPKPSQPGAVDLGAAPRRALAAGTQLSSVLIVALALTAITQPFLPIAGSAAVLGAILVLMAVAVWRSARNLEGHVRAGAEVIVEALAREAKGDDRASLERIEELVPGIGHPVPVRIDGNGRHVGRSLRELNLRGITGATVLAVRRGEESIVWPSPDERLQAGDIVVLAGTRDAVAAARALLNEK
jgi:monovalent cation:H+ antiporter-2, CPA2 family